MKSWKRLILIALTLYVALLAACVAEGYSRKTPADVVKAYAELRYTNNADYEQYVCFKTKVLPMLVQSVISENAELMKTCYKVYAVSDVSYSAGGRLSDQEISAITVMDGKTIVEAERGTLSYHLTMVCNEEGVRQRLPEQDRDFTEDIICVKIDGLWYVYLDMH